MILPFFANMYNICSKKKFKNNNKIIEVKCRDQREVGSEMSWIPYPYQKTTLDLNSIFHPSCTSPYILPLLFQTLSSVAFFWESYFLCFSFPVQHQVCAERDRQGGREAEREQESGQDGERNDCPFGPRFEQC